MRALELIEPGRMRLFDMPEPGAPGEGECLVEVLRTGICGTDLHAYRGRQPFFTYPRILGHELAVRILASGRGVKDLEEGDRCTVEPFLNCGECAACRRNKTNCCERLRTYGVHIDGGMRERFLYPARKLHRSAVLSPEQLATVEPLCIGSHAFHRAQVRGGDSVVVIGSGPIGLAVAEAARAAGVEPWMVEVSPARARFARERLNLLVLTEIAGDLPQVIFDCTGNQNSMMSCFERLSHGGTIVFVGIHNGDLSFSNPNFHAREVTLLSSRNATAEDFQRVMRLLESGRVDVEAWWGKPVAAAEVPEAFPGWLDPEAGVIKPLIDWNL